MKWFRFYSEVLDDPKVQNLSPELFKIWINILCITCHHTGVLPPIKDVSFRLRVTLDETKLAFQALLEAGLIQQIKNQHGINYAPHNWKKRQYSSDTSTERVKRFRAVSRNVSETVTETPPDTDTDTEQNRKESILSDFEGFWNLYGFKVGKQKAQISYNNARKKGATREIIIGGVERYQRASQAKGTPAKFIKHPATWLNGEHWNDEYPEYADNRSDTKQTGDTNRNRALSALFNA